MTIPIESATFVYVPKSLKDIEGAPKFTFRYGTRRDKHVAQQEIARRGLIRHSTEDIRDATLIELRRNSKNAQETIELMVETAERYWLAMEELANARQAWLKEMTELKKSGSDEAVSPYPELEFDKKEEVWISNIINTVASESALVGNMRADNQKFDFEAKEIYLSAVLLSAEGFDLKRREDSMIENQSLIDLEEWLGDKAEALGLDSFDAGRCYNDLGETAEQSFWLPREARKNFSSLPRITSSPINSTPLDEAAGDTLSKRSESLLAAPKNTSPHATSELLISPSPVEMDGETLVGQTVAG